MHEFPIEYGFSAAAAVVITLLVFFFKFSRWTGKVDSRLIGCEENIRKLHDAIGVIQSDMKPLHRAVAANNPARIQALIAAGANVNAVTE